MHGISDTVPVERVREGLRGVCDQNGRFLVSCTYSAPEGETACLGLRRCGIQAVQRPSRLQKTTGLRIPLMRCVYFVIAFGQAYDSNWREIWKPLEPCQALPESFEWQGRPLLQHNVQEQHVR